MSQASRLNGSGGGGGGTDLHVARYIVSAGGTTDGANYTTITAAYAAAVAKGGNQTVFIQPGTYTENLTLSPGINLTAFPCDAYTPNVIIVGKITMTATGSASISGINLTTNSDYVLEVTGSNVITLNLVGCAISATNANAIHCTNGNANISLFQCNGDCSTNTFFIVTGGGINVKNSRLAGNNTVTNSTFNGGAFNSQYCYLSFPITTSSTGSVSFTHSELLCANTTSLTHGGSGNSIAIDTRFESGSASAISISSSIPIIQCSVFSTNTNAITGSGTLYYAFISFYGPSSSSGVNINTVIPYATLI